MGEKGQFTIQYQELRTGSGSTDIWQVTILIVRQVKGNREKKRERKRKREREREKEKERWSVVFRGFVFLSKLRATNERVWYGGEINERSAKQASICPIAAIR